MPHSGDDFDELLRLKLTALKPASVFDVGIGAGKIGQMARSCVPKTVITGVEVEASYKTRFSANWAAYDSTHIGSALTWSETHADKRFDLVIAGDVLEHLWAHEVRSLLSFWIPRSKWLIAIWPTGYPQDAHEGIVSEIHKCSPLLSDFTDLDVRHYEKRDRKPGLPGHKHFLLLKGST